mgnify:CR=1 FL=1
MIFLNAKFELNLAYDAKRALLQFEGYFIMKSNDRPLDLISLLNTKNGRPQNSPLKVITIFF